MAQADTRVLIVDDSADDREWLLSLLRAERVADDVAHADSLASAAHALDSSSYTLVITDHSMPDGNGVELTVHPRVLAEHIPVIVITGQEQPNQGMALLERGATDFLPKDDLTARALARACAHAQARRQLEIEVEASRRAEYEARLASDHALAEATVALARVRALQALTAALSAASTRADVCAASMGDGAVYERATAGALFELCADTFELRASFGYDADERERWSALPRELPTPLSDAVARGKLVCVRNKNELVASYGELGAREGSWAVLPLAREGRTIGVLSLRFQADELPDGTWLEYLKLVGTCLSEALTRAQWYEDAQASAAQEERLLAMVGHDLRTPLAAISLGVSLLRKEATDNPILARLERSARSMSELIRDILNRAELRRGREPEGQLTRADSETVLRDQVDELRAAFPSRRLELSVDVAEPVECDPVRLSQLVTNLVRNAVQHGDPSAPVNVHYTADGDRVRLAVHNLGPTIPASQLPALFNPFARGRASRGTGLGLFIVHETVSPLGGRIDVRSDDSGTTFTLELPRDCWAQRASLIPEASR